MNQIFKFLPLESCLRFQHRAPQTCICFVRPDISTLQFPNILVTLLGLFWINQISLQFYLHVTGLLYLGIILQNNLLITTVSTYMYVNGNFLCFIWYIFVYKICVATVFRLGIKSMACLLHEQTLVCYVYVYMYISQNIIWFGSLSRLGQWAQDMINMLAVLWHNYFFCIIGNPCYFHKSMWISYFLHLADSIKSVLDRSEKWLVKSLINGSHVAHAFKPFEK